MAKLIDGLTNTDTQKQKPVQKWKQLGTFKKFLKLFLFYAYRSFYSSIYVYIPLGSLMTKEARRVHWIPGNWNYRWLWAATWILGIKPGSSEGAAMLLTFESSLLKMHVVTMSFNSVRTPFKILQFYVWRDGLVVKSTGCSFQAWRSVSSIHIMKLTMWSNSSSSYPTSAGLHNDLNTSGTYTNTHIKKNPWLPDMMVNYAIFHKIRSLSLFTNFYVTVKWSHQ